MVNKKFIFNLITLNFSRIFDLYFKKWNLIFQNFCFFNFINFNFFKVPLYSQCGGQGSKTCQKGSCCVLNDFFSQCLLTCPEVIQQSDQVLTDSLNVLKVIFSNQEGNLFTF